MRHRRAPAGVIRLPVKRGDRYINKPDPKPKRTGEEYILQSTVYRSTATVKYQQHRHSSILARVDWIIGLVSSSTKTS